MKNRTEHEALSYFFVRVRVGLERVQSTRLPDPLVSQVLITNPGMLWLILYQNIPGFVYIFFTESSKWMIG